MGYPQDTDQTREDYADYLKGKRVIVVGPAPHMDGSKMGDFIDSYDVVVRVNRGYRISKDMVSDLGQRTDILYQTMLPHLGMGTTTPIEELKNKMQWVSASFPDKKHKPMIEKFIKFNSNRMRFHIIDKKYWESLRKKVDVPHSGTVAIFDMIKHDIKELYVAGITFYQATGPHGAFYYEGYHKKANKKKWAKGTKHDCSRTFKYFKKISEKDNRIKCDHILEELLK